MLHVFTYAILSFSAIISSLHAFAIAPDALIGRHAMVTSLAADAMPFDGYLPDLPPCFIINFSRHHAIYLLVAITPAVYY